MRLSILFTLLTLISLPLSCNLKWSEKQLNKPFIQNIDGTITIQGRVIDPITNLPPEGITTINISNKWKWLVKIPGVPKNGENEKVFLDKKGFFSITINKEDTIQVLPTKLLYQTNLHNYKITNLKNNQILNFTVKRDSTIYKEVLKSDPRAKEILATYLSQSNPEKIITISGTIASKITQKPIANASVGVFGINNITGAMTFHMTDNYGQFSMQVPKNSIFILNPATPQSKYFKVTNDTVINILQ
ncbi:hypothetical protein ACYSNV_04520 [Myroides sp. LJL119]